MRPRDNENAASTMRVTAIVRIRFSRVDVSENGWDKDEKADTSATIITRKEEGRTKTKEEGAQDEWRKEKKRKKEKRKEKKRKEETDKEQRQSKG